MSFIKTGAAAYFCSVIVVLLIADFAVADDRPHADFCSNEISGVGLISVEAMIQLNDFVSELVAEDAIGATIGKKSYIVSEVKRLKGEGEQYNERLLKFNVGSDNGVDSKLARRESSLLKKSIADKAGVVYRPELHSKYLECAMQAVARSSDSKFSVRLNLFLDQAAKRFDRARVGHFQVTLNSCVAKDRVGTGNSFAEPKVWEGSRFLVIDATFKNIDTEGRLPAEGQVIFKSGGKEYLYDHTESILLDGYGIFLDSINPFVSMRTKIVYRIPLELRGEVFWRPGRNSSGISLWCGFI